MPVRVANKPVPSSPHPTRAVCFWTKRFSLRQRQSPRQGCEEPRRPRGFANKKRFTDGREEDGGAGGSASEPLLRAGGTARYSGHISPSILNNPFAEEVHFSYLMLCKHIE